MALPTDARAKEAGLCIPSVWEVPNNSDWQYVDGNVYHIREWYSDAANGFAGRIVANEFQRPSDEQGGGQTSEQFTLLSEIVQLGEAIAPQLNALGIAIFTARENRNGRRSTTHTIYYPPIVELEARSGKEVEAERQSVLFLEHRGEYPYDATLRTVAAARSEVLLPGDPELARTQVLARVVATTALTKDVLSGIAGTACELRKLPERYTPGEIKLAYDRFARGLDQGITPSVLLRVVQAPEENNLRAAALALCANMEPSTFFEEMQRHLGDRLNKTE